MIFKKVTGICLLAFASFSWADNIPADNYLYGADRMGKLAVRQIEKRTTTTTVKAASSTSVSSSSSSLVADASCTNGPNTRACWNGGYSIATDFDQKHPSTGNTVTYNLEITNATCSPDGNGPQQCLLINGQYPGPTIVANWGDMIVVNVKNSMQNNGTSIHWHGIRQLNSVGSDGVNGITECALAPGKSRTYQFQATQFGTSWYHSHFSSQYSQGIVGTILINGPATSNYDVDLGVLPLTEWYYQGYTQQDQQALSAAQAGGPAPAANNILINGTGIAANGGGHYAQVTVQPGKKHRLRVINTSADNFFRFKLDSHALTIIAADFIPVKPIPNQDWILLAIGQRYDVVFTANQTAGTYYFRAESASDCASSSNGKGRALFTYAGQTANAPTDSSPAPPQDGCTEIVTVPYWKQAVDSSTFKDQMKTLSTQFSPSGVVANGQNLVLWSLNTTTMNVMWDNPTMQYVMTGNTSYPADLNVIEIPNAGVWTYWVIQEVANSPPIPHPIHLHGHDFFVLGTGSGQFNASTQTSALNFATPPRRDTTILPGGGWVIVAFPANNPGSWLMHCHIASHISEGLGVQFLEAKNSIVLPDATQFNQQCADWKAYSATALWQKQDSGL